MTNNTNWTTVGNGSAQMTYKLADIPLKVSVPRGSNAGSGTNQRAIKASIASKKALVIDTSEWPADKRFGKLSAIRNAARRLGYKTTSRLIDNNLTFWFTKRT